MNEHLFEEYKSSPNSSQSYIYQSKPIAPPPRKNDFLKYLNDLSSIGDNQVIDKEQHEMMNADSPIHSESECSIDEFQDLKKGAKDYHGNDGRRRDAHTTNGFTNMGSDPQYRKSSKENFLQKMNSQEMIQANYHGQQQSEIKQNNIIIDLTNQLYEEAKFNTQYGNNSSQQQQQHKLNGQQQILYQQLQSQIPQDIVRQKDIDDFKKQIQLDLQKLTQVLEENTKKQFQQQQQEMQKQQQMKLDSAKIQRSIQAEMSQEYISNSHVMDNSPHNKDIQSELSSIKNGTNVNNSMISNGQPVKVKTQEIKQDYHEPLMELHDEEIEKHGKSLAKGYKQPSKGPQGQSQPTKVFNGSSTDQSVKSVNTSHHQKNHPSLNTQAHQRLKSAQGGTANNQFYLNLQSLQNTQTKVPTNQTLYSTGFRNQYSNLRSNSREKRIATSNYHTKSPQSYSSVASYSIKSKSAAKNTLKGVRKTQNGSHVIVEEDNDASFYQAMMQENEDLRQQLHQLRLKNAEHRNEIQKVKRDHTDTLNHNGVLEEKCRQYEKQRKKDCDYILKQETEIEKFLEAKLHSANLARVQEEQINNLKNILNQTINVKIKYENIIKRLVGNEKSRDMVLRAIEQVQNQQYQQQPTIPNTTLDHSQPLSPSLFNSTLPSNFKGPMTGVTSMNVTQNISQMLATAAAKALGKTQVKMNEKNFDAIKPQQDFDFDDDNDEEVIDQHHQDQSLQNSNAPKGNDYEEEEYGGASYKAQNDSSPRFKKSLLYQPRNDIDNY